MCYSNTCLLFQRENNSIDLYLAPYDPTMNSQHFIRGKKTKFEVPIVNVSVWRGTHCVEGLC